MSDAFRGGRAMPTFCRFTEPGVLMKFHIRTKVLCILLIDKRGIEKVR